MGRSSGFGIPRNRYWSAEGRCVYDGRARRSGDKRGGWKWRTGKSCDTSICRSLFWSEVHGGAESKDGRLDSVFGHQENGDRVADGDVDAAQFPDSREFVHRSYFPRLQRPGIWYVCTLSVSVKAMVMVNIGYGEKPGDGEGERETWVVMARRAAVRVT